MVQVVLVLARSRLVQMSLEIRISIHVYFGISFTLLLLTGAVPSMNACRARTTFNLTGVLSNIHDYSCSYGSRFPMKRGHIPVLFVSGVMFSSFSSSSFTLSRNVPQGKPCQSVSRRTCS